MVVQLRDIVEEYEGLRKSRCRNWDRLRLGIKNLGDLRGKLTLHTSCLTTYLNTVGISAIGCVEKRVNELPEMKKAIDGLAAESRAGRKEGSVTTTYTNDDTDIWRQFRRELIGEGFSSGSIQRFSSHLKDYLRRLRDQGLLEKKNRMAMRKAYWKTRREYCLRMLLEPNFCNYSHGVSQIQHANRRHRPSCDYDEPFEGEGSEVKITCEGQTAHAGGGVWKVETPTISKPAPFLPALGSEHGRESARDSPPRACRSYSRMDLDQLHLSDTESEVSISREDKRGVPLIVDKTESITHAYGYCSLSNNVRIRASNHPLGGERASQSPRQSEPPKLIRYNVPIIEEEAEDRDHQEDSDDKDPQFLKPDIHTEMTSQSKNWKRVRYFLFLVALNSRKHTFGHITSLLIDTLMRHKRRILSARLPARLHVIGQTHESKLPSQTNQINIRRLPANVRPHVRFRIRRSVFQRPRARLVALNMSLVGEEQRVDVGCQRGTVVHQVQTQACRQMPRRLLSLTPLTGEPSLNCHPGLKTMNLKMKPTKATTLTSTY